MTQLIVLALVVCSVMFALFGVWLLVAQHSASRNRVAARLQGVRQVKRYELGDALAAVSYTHLTLPTN